MDLQRGQLKRAAREAMRVSRPSAWRLTMLYLLVTTGLATVMDFATGDLWLRLAGFLQQGLSIDRALALAVAKTGRLALFLNILMVFYQTVMEFGYRRWTLNAARGCAAPADLLGGFGMAWRVILLRIVTAVYAMLWYMAAFLPALFLAAVLGGGAGGMAAIAVAAAVCLLCLLRYWFAPYCLMDDEKPGVFRAMRGSLRLTRGNTWGLIVLLASFVGWYALCGLIYAGAGAVALLLTGGWTAVTAAAAGGETPVWIDTIASVCVWPLAAWVLPYVEITVCGFYDRICRKEKQETAQAV